MVALEVGESGLGLGKAFSRQDRADCLSLAVCTLRVNTDHGLNAISDPESFHDPVVVLGIELAASYGHTSAFCRLAKELNQILRRGPALTTPSRRIS